MMIPGLRHLPSRGPDVRRRRLVRWNTAARRPSPRCRKASTTVTATPYALFKQPLAVEEILASPEIFDPPTRRVLPPDLRRRRGGTSYRRVCQEERISNSVYIAAQAGDDRLRVELRRPVHDEDGRLRHDQERRGPGLRAGRHRPRGR